MKVSDILEGAKAAGYHIVEGQNGIMITDDGNGSIHWTQPSHGLIVFARFGNYAAINSASSRKDETRMLRKMGLGAYV